MERTVDITELFRKLKFICHWANPFRDFERTNVLGIKLSSFSESDDTFTSLQALSNLHYLFQWFHGLFLVLAEMCGVGKAIDNDPDPMCPCPFDVIFLAFLKELIYRVLGLQVPFLGLNRFGIILGKREEGQVSVSHFDIVKGTNLIGWEYLAIEARYMDTKLYSAQNQQNTTNYSWSDGPPFATVVGVGVTVVVVIIVAVVVVVVESAFVVKLSFLQFPVQGASLGLVVLLVFAMLAACASRVAKTLSTTSYYGGKPESMAVLQM
ncbi:hypothetical protein Tco_0086949 [Tanacetum coccineum]